MLVCCSAAALLVLLLVALALAADPLPLADPLALPLAVPVTLPLAPVAVALAAALPLATALAVAHAPNPTVAAVYVLPAACSADEQTLFESWMTAMRSEEVQVEWQRQGIAESWMAVWPVVHWHR